jgi:hypothetical protein
MVFSPWVRPIGPMGRLNRPSITESVEHGMSWIQSKLSGSSSRLQAEGRVPGDFARLNYLPPFKSCLRTSQFLEFVCLSAHQPTWQRLTSRDSSAEGSRLRAASANYTSQANSPDRPTFCKSARPKQSPGQPPRRVGNTRRTR